jgi:hypothetical protein
VRLLDAFRHVQERRRFVEPNSGFREQLIAFEKAELGSCSLDESSEYWPEPPAGSWDITRST